MSQMVKVTGTSDGDQSANNGKDGGAFVRGASTCRNIIGTGDYEPEYGRYHLYVAFNCPWCHRVALARAVLGLTNSITMDVCFPSRSDEIDSKGRSGVWQFAKDGYLCKNGKFTKFDECTDDTIFGKKTIVEIYDEFNIDQKSVPILFDKKTNTIVNNESAEIIRMLGLHATALGSNITSPPVLYPEIKATEIDEANDWTYHDINNGAYKAGFSGSQEAYEAAYFKYFAALERLDKVLIQSEFIVGDSITEVDIRVFPTLFRHDPVYYSRFKLSHAMLKDYPNVWRWMKSMYQVHGVKSVADSSILKHCKQGYFGRTGSNTIPIGPPGYPECFY